MPSASSASSKPLSDKLYAALHAAFNRVAKMAYERGYEDGKANPQPRTPPTEDTAMTTYQPVQQTPRRELHSQMEAKLRRAGLPFHDLAVFGIYACHVHVLALLTEAFGLEASARAYAEELEASARALEASARAYAEELEASARALVYLPGPAPA